MCGCRGKTLFAIITALILNLVCNTAGYAETNPPESSMPFYWANMGVGKSLYDLTLGVSASMQFSQIIVGGRFTYSTDLYWEPDIFGFDPTPDPPTYEIYDLGILIGYSTKKPQSFGFASIAAGVGMMGGDLYETAFGVPIEAQLFITPSSTFGFGIYGYLNLNSEKTFSGVLFCIQLGDLR
jgi:hypothetical protein